MKAKKFDDQSPACRLAHVVLEYEEEFEGAVEGDRPIDCVTWQEMIRLADEILKRVPSEES